jgi:hypothetical protein
VQPTKKESAEALSFSPYGAFTERSGDAPQDVPASIPVAAAEQCAAEVPFSAAAQVLLPAESACIPDAPEQVWLPASVEEPAEPSPARGGSPGAAVCSQTLAAAQDELLGAPFVQGDIPDAGLGPAGL